MIPTKSELFTLGLAHINRWCAANGVLPPTVESKEGRPDFGVCAYYTGLGYLDKTWGFTFTLFFLILFIASVISITPSFPKES